MTNQSHFIVDVNMSYQHADLPAIESHSLHVELRPGLDGVIVREAIRDFIERKFGVSAQPKIIKVKVVAISSNRNSFGLRNVVMFTENGEAYRALSSDYNLPKLNEVFEAKVAGDGQSPAFETIVTRGWECIEAMRTPDLKTFKTAWEAR